MPPAAGGSAWALVLMLTARDDIRDLARGLDAGQMTTCGDAPRRSATLIRMPGIGAKLVAGRSLASWNRLWSRPGRRRHRWP